MENLDRTMLMWENYSPMERFIIETACNLTDVPVDKVTENSKNRKVMFFEIEATLIEKLSNLFYLKSRCRSQDDCYLSDSH